MNLLPDVDRILLGPGPSLTAPRVMRAMAAPTVSHLGASSSPRLIVLRAGALESALASQSRQLHA
jgi:aspartate aminotransferase-like enzyme